MGGHDGDKMVACCARRYTILHCQDQVFIRHIYQTDILFIIPNKYMANIWKVL